MDFSILLLSNALILGLRHGLDLDHVAAIMDINSGVNNINSSKIKSLIFASMYALGHALIVIILGLGAIYFAFNLPNNIDPVMERVVGFTLIILGLVVLYSLGQNLINKETIRLQSRWMIILEFLGKAYSYLNFKLFKIKSEKSPALIKYGLQASFFLGIIHGLGAETGSQILLISSVRGVRENNLAAIILLTFVLGLLISNTLVAIISKTAIVTSKKINYIYIMLGILTFGFNTVVGYYFILGKASNLPSLF